MFEFNKKENAIENFDNKEVTKKVEAYFHKKYGEFSLELLRREIKKDVNFYKLIGTLNISVKEFVVSFIQIYGQELFTKSIITIFKKYLQEE